LVFDGYFTIVNLRLLDLARSQNSHHIFGFSRPGFPELLSKLPIRVLQGKKSGCISQNRR
jgi:hypothetical protein